MFRHFHVIIRELKLQCHKIIKILFNRVYSKIVYTR